MPAELIIHDGNWGPHVEPVVNGERVSRGCVPRDYAVQPRPAHAVEFPLVPRAEWSARIRGMVATQSRLSDLRLYGNGGTPVPSLDQNGQGFCWAYSTTMAVMMMRLRAGSPYVPLSAHAVACKIKNFQDEGAWGALSQEFVSKNGVPSQARWPQGSMDRAHDTPETWADARKYRITRGYADLDGQVWDRNLTFAQVMTLLLNRVPVVADFMWWGHSVCLLDPVEVEPGSFGVRLINSWGDAWGDRGMAVLQGDRAVPDNATAPMVVTA